ncbi:general transcription factor IIF subunit 1-like protein [Sarcoptes scabiei]|uniref:Transcription initiation factor IIF subunit alpha n=1 Tax=Sarcoptes scabiei TaxID=52283 RepID=A0A131ZVW6_SARSC|nr:general transcription factor IIF subunit 1-like protein [Sarcoptes scabiei]
MSADQKKYTVRIPSENKKQFHVMRFNSAHNVDISKFRNCKLEREVLFKETREQPEEQQLPEFGAGSEYGRKEKEEARRRKFDKRKMKQNNSPWILKIGGKQGKKYRGVREGGVTENASYYVFFQASDGIFEALPVDEWYNFQSFQRYKALSAEEAEEKFVKRDQILNFFQLRNNAKTKSEGEKDEFSRKEKSKIKKEFKVSDMDDWFDNSENEDLSADNDSEEDTKLKKTKNKKKNKVKKEIDSDDDEPLEDSDEGDNDDKEVDYMSDISSSSESEEEKVNLKGVVDESALRDLVLSEEDEEDAENKKEDDEQNDSPTKNDPENKNNDSLKKEKRTGNESGSDSDYDLDNSDIEDSKLAFLIQKSQPRGTKNKLDSDSKSNELKKRKTDDTLTNNNLNNENNNGTSSSQAISITSAETMKLKLKLPENSPPLTTDQQMNKKSKFNYDNGITEEAVRRYLIRKPMTATDLVQKFKHKTSNRDKLPDLLAEILRKINPDKQNIKGKMYFSLRPT